ncbi:MAG: hypothetical protein Q9220_004880 [cf. Caloplaca sp. 1 TL-2023]
MKINATDGRGESPKQDTRESISLDEMHDDSLESIAQSIVEASKAQNLLHEAVRLARLDLIRRILDKGAVIDGLDPDGNTPLYNAVKLNLGKVVKMLLDNSADTEVACTNTGTPGEMPLHYAARKGFTATVSLLLDCGANIEAHTTKNQSTPLHKAIQGGSTAAAQTLIRSGANVNALDRTGEAPLHTAIIYGNSEIIRELCDCGADINQKYTELIPLHMAIMKDNIDVITSLLAAGANPRAKSFDDSTALHFCAHNGRVDLAMRVLDADRIINPDSSESFLEMRLSDGRTVLHLAAHLHQLDLVECLLDQNADMRALNKELLTPGEEAINNWGGSYNASRIIELFRDRFRKAGEQMPYEAGSGRVGYREQRLSAGWAPKKLEQGE